MDHHKIIQILDIVFTAFAAASLGIAFLLAFNAVAWLLKGNLGQAGSSALFSVLGLIVWFIFHDLRRSTNYN